MLEEGFEREGFEEEEKACEEGRKLKKKKKEEKGSLKGLVFCEDVRLSWF
jgi:hypothetical protein